MWWILFVGLGVALVAGIIVAVVLAERKRRRELAAWATRIGLSAFDATPHLTWQRDFQAWGPGYGHRNFDGYAGHVDGAYVEVWQHQSRTKSKDSENIHNFTLCLVDAKPDSPGLVVKREGWHHKVFDALGGEDIDFESDEFSRKFWVRGKDRKFAYDVISPRMMEWLLDTPKATYEWQGSRLLVSTGGSLTAKRAPPLVANALGFLNHIPRHVQEA